ncbi:hypothetical protein CP8484711_0316, partial [Chlamydia psittaci 84-8471/1]
LFKVVKFFHLLLFRAFVAWLLQYQTPQFLRCNQKL